MVDQLEFKAKFPVERRVTLKFHNFVVQEMNSKIKILKLQIRKLENELEITKSRKISYLEARNKDLEHENQLLAKEISLLGIVDVADEPRKLSFHVPINQNTQDGEMQETQFSEDFHPPSKIPNVENKTIKRVRQRKTRRKFQGGYF